VRGAASWTAWLALVFLVLGTCGSTSDALQPENIRLSPEPPVEIQLPEHPIVAGTSVGYLPGSPEVSPSGALTYHVQLDVPPGIAGMEPVLALDYSSQTGSGLLGRGWSLSGSSSAVTRCPKSFAVNGERDGVDFDTSDGYCLDGQPLVDDGDGGYRTESDTISRIVKSGVLPAAPIFTVYLKNGRIRTYQSLAPAQRVSATAQGLTLTAGVILEWPLHEEADRSGNVIKYVYKHDQNPVAPYDEEVLLDRIDYTGSVSGTSARRSVQLEYEVRPDKSFAYHNGIRYQLRTRLQLITMSAPNPVATSLVWEYKLHYVDGEQSQLGRSLLSSVQKCGYLGTCTFAKNFIWNLNGYPAYYESVSQPLTGTVPPESMLFLDANGDGRDDILYKVIVPEGFLAHTAANSQMERMEHRMLLSRPGSDPVAYDDVLVGSNGDMGTGTGLLLDTMNLDSSRAVDFDGQGRDGLIVSHPHYYEPARWDSTQHQFLAVGPQIQADKLDVMDADGDSLLDLVGWTGAHQIWARLSNGDGTFQPASSLYVASANCDIPPLGGDLDGDGRSEVVIGVSSLCDTSIGVGRNDSGALSDAPSLPVRRGTRDVKFGDLNGDGLPDALWLGDILEISFNTGNGFGPPQQVNSAALDEVFALNTNPSKRSALVMDVDRDGRDDLLFTVHDHVTADVYTGTIVTTDPVVALLSNGDGTFRIDYLNDVVPGRGLHTGDFDGDGRTDLLAVTPHGSLKMYLQRSEGHSDLLIEVQDGETPSQPSLQVTYGRTDPTSWAGSTCTYPTLCVRRGAEVVTSISGLDVGPAALYSFEEPRLDMRGRGFLGYATVRLWSPSRPMERTTTFDNVTRVGTIYPNAHRPKSVRTVTPIVDHDRNGVVGEPASGNARVSLTIYDYGLRQTGSGLSSFIYAAAVHEKEWEESVAIDWNLSARVHITGIDGPGPYGPPRQHEVSFRVDEYNNLLGLSESTLGGVNHDINRTFETRPADWLVGLVATVQEASWEAGQSPDWLHVANQYDALGHLEVSTIEPGGDPDDTLVRSLEYDGRGRLIQDTRAAAGQSPRVRHFAYDDLSGEGVFLSQQWDEVDSTIALSKWMFAVPGYGGTMGIIDTNGGVATTIHDDLGRPVNVSGAGAQPMSITYSAWTKSGSTVGIEAQVDDAMGGSSVVNTDARGLEMERRRVGFGGQMSVTEAGYDSFGRVLWKSRPGWGTASLGRTEYTYDSLDRLRTTQAPDGALSTQAYTFFERTTTDPQMRVRKVVQDADRRVVSAIDMHDGSPLETSYSYVHGSQPEWVIDPENNVIHSVFDVRGRRTLLEDPDAGSRRTRYDGFGDVVETADAMGNTTSYTLDSMGRVTEIGSTIDGTTTLTWDTRPHGLGQLATTVSPDQTTVESFYDDIGRPTKTNWTVPGPVISMFSVEQTYDIHGRVDELRYPYALNRPRMVVHPVYDGASGGVSAIEAMGGDGNMFEAWSVTERNADDSLAVGHYGAEIVTNRAYDPLNGRLKAVSTTAGAAATPIVDFEYHYYNDGRLSDRQDNVTARSEQFVYDDLRRLNIWSISTGSNNSSTYVGYGYDTLGNLTNVDDINGVHTETNLYTGGGPHQLTQRDGVVYHYDGRGRLDSSNAGLDVEYTDFDLPRSYTSAGVTTDFNYDAAHHRVRKAGPSETTITLGDLYERRETTQGTKHVFKLNGPDGMIAQVVYDQAFPPQDEHVEYLHQDPLGSVVLATTVRGSEIERLFYEPFGKRIDASGQPVSATSDVLAGFTGHRHDDDLGLIDMRGRTYNPVLRRFLQPDPVIQDAYAGQNYNRYSYVMNDPVNLTDPTGYVWNEREEWVLSTGGGSPSDVRLTSEEIVVTGKPIEAGSTVSNDGITTVSDDTSGDGPAVRSQGGKGGAYDGDGSSAGRRGGSGRGAGRMCDGCSERDGGSAFLVYAPYVERGLLYMSAGALSAAAVVAALPGMAVGGLASGGTGLIGGATASGVGAAVTAAAGPAAAIAKSPTAQEVLLEVENAASGGTATIFQHEGNHVSILVEHGEEVLHTEQLVLESNATTIVIVQDAAKVLKEVQVQLPDAASAMNFQQSVLGTDTGVYNRSLNSCVTHIRDVLRAAGVNGVPERTLDIGKWLKGQ
jgi:RHS repeat-associated protein